MKPDVESCRPVSQATSSLDAGHDVPCTSGKHEGEARNSSPDLEPVKQKSEPGSRNTKWTEEEFILSVEYFANECKLPNDGLVPGDIQKSLVSDELLEKCFGPRTGKNGRNGPKISNCTGLPQSEVLHLFQVIDGHDKPVNGTLGVAFPRALPKRVYTPPTTLVLEPLLTSDTEHKGSSPSEQKGSPSEQKSRPLRASEVLAKEEVEERIVHDWTDNVGSDECSTKLKPSSAPEGSTSAVVIGRSKMPGVETLKADICVRKESVEKLRGEVKTLTDAVDNNRQKLQDSEESMTRAEKTLKKEKSMNNQVRIDRIAMEKKKQELETWLDDGGFDEENPEDKQLLASLEEEEEDLNKKLSGLLSAIEVSTQRQLQLEEQLQSTRANVNNLDTVIKKAEAEIEKKVSLFESEKSILASQEAKVKILDRMAEVPVSVLAPRFVPTATEVTKSVFRLTSCPVCSLGFHCVNFMPTSCGHAYHPACLMSLIARSGEPKCIECEEYFHPHWCESWGIDTTEEHRRRWEAELCLQRQRDAFSECISDLYTKTPHVLSERRKVEKEKRQRLTLKYTAAGVERSSAISCATTRVRAHVLAPNVIDSEGWTDHPSCRSTIRISLTDDREEDVIILDVNVLLTRSKKGKRLSSKGNDRTESMRKVRTRSYISEAEMCAGIGSPGPNTKIFVKPLRECRTPEAKTNTGFPSSSLLATKKLFT
ncbi:hypothetical protein R1sor_023917 [Riccia sorocarpa]|uniref:RING-type domain-containing protein n=1 Tax=Riccia sorocarpa TaxID=122646 RepID=A0ABD3GQJ9_9MARC